MLVVEASENKAVVVEKQVPTDRRATAEGLFGFINWKDEITGHMECPGVHTHTGPNGPRDCQIKIDGVPTIYCVHMSCEEEIKEANKALYAATPSLTSLLSKAEQRKLAAAAKGKAAREESVKVRAKKALPSVLKSFAWPYDKIIADSPTPIQADDRVGMFQAFMGMLEKEDVVWIGDVADTGKIEHASHFKNKGEWLEELVPVGPFTCPSCFAVDSHSRSKDNVVAQRYLVVESDSLKKDEVGAIFRWLDEAVELPLCAVVDTAGKSLHGWFEFPPEDVLSELKLMLPAMGCDPKMFGSSQPCRLPGGLRDGRIQKLIYSAKGGAQ